MWVSSVYIRNCLCTNQTCNRVYINKTMKYFCTYLVFLCFSFGFNKIDCKCIRRWLMLNSFVSYPYPVWDSAWCTKKCDQEYCLNKHLNELSISFVSFVFVDTVSIRIHSHHFIDTYCMCEVTGLSIWYSLYLEQWFSAPFRSKEKNVDYLPFQNMVLKLYQIILV